MGLKSGWSLITLISIILSYTLNLHPALGFESETTVNQEVTKKISVGFVKGSTLWSCDGSERIIDELQVGDLVMAYDVRTASCTEKQVTQTYQFELTDVIQLNLGPIKIEVAPEQRLLVALPVGFKTIWKLAKDLKTGDLFVTPSGVLHQISAIHKIHLDEPSIAHSIEVEGLHTFLVSPYGIVVHNPVFLFGITWIIGEGITWSLGALGMGALGVAAAVQQNDAREREARNRQNNHSHGQQHQQHSNQQQKMFGQNGTQMNGSKTMWEGKSKERIDIENVAPGGRSASLHYHDSKNIKYEYDPKTGSFPDAPRAVSDKLKDPDFKKGIEKGLKYLGEKR